MNTKAKIILHSDEATITESHFVWSSLSDEGWIKVGQSRSIYEAPYRDCMFPLLTSINSLITVPPIRQPPAAVDHSRAMRSVLVLLWKVRSHQLNSPYRRQLPSRWRGIVKGWYVQGLADTPGIGNLRHHTSLLNYEKDSEELKMAYHFNWSKGALYYLKLLWYSFYLLAWPHYFPSYFSSMLRESVSTERLIFTAIKEMLL